MQQDVRMLEWLPAAGAGAGAGTEAVDEVGEEQL
jgi:hypothetical protein